MLNFHKPVMSNEVLQFLQVRVGGKYIDCTVGDGGHTIEILKAGGMVLGFDYNAESLKRAQNRIIAEGLERNFVAVKGNFRDINTLTKGEKFDGILYDLGYSSYQLDGMQLGLSFMKESVLDMRLDDSLGVKASDLVNTLPEKQLGALIYKYSDERLAYRFAKAIVKSRDLKKIQTTGDLVKIIVDEAPPGYEMSRIHPATRVFQALRIAVNDELGNLQTSLPRAEHMLLPGGRMVIISFHSLEDKLVKDFGRGARLRLSEVVKGPLRPGDIEVQENVRARSARLRVYAKI